jgi:hypothetical protein
MTTITSHFTQLSRYARRYLHSPFVYQMDELQALGAAHGNIRSNNITMIINSSKRLHRKFVCPRNGINHTRKISWSHGICNTIILAEVLPEYIFTVVKPPV